MKIILHNTIINEKGESEHEFSIDSSGQSDLNQLVNHANLLIAELNAVLYQLNELQNNNQNQI